MLPLHLFSHLTSAVTCDLLSTLPEPLKSLEGECVDVNDCLNYASPGFCRGAATVQVCLTIDIVDELTC